MAILDFSSKRNEGERGRKGRRREKISKDEEVDEKAKEEEKRIKFKEKIDWVKLENYYMVDEKSNQYKGCGTEYT